MSCGIGTDYVADDVMGVFFGLRSVVEIGGKEKEKRRKRIGPNTLP